MPQSVNVLRDRIEDRIVHLFELTGGLTTLTTRLLQQTTGQPAYARQNQVAGRLIVAANEIEAKLLEVLREVNRQRHANLAGKGCKGKGKGN